MPSECNNLHFFVLRPPFRKKKLINSNAKSCARRHAQTKMRQLGYGRHLLVIFPSRELPVEEANNLHRIWDMGQWQNVVILHCYFFSTMFCAWFQYFFKFYDKQNVTEIIVRSNLSYARFSRSFYEQFFNSMLRMEVIILFQGGLKGRPMIPCAIFVKLYKRDGFSCRMVMV